MDKNDIPAPAAQPDVSPESEILYWQWPRRRRVSLATATLRRSGVSWWFRQVRNSVDGATSEQPNPGPQE
jgi:hypothetical protein